MALDIGANFKITAGVIGQAAVDKLNAGAATLDKQLSALPGVAKTAGMALAGLGAGVGVAVLKEKFDGVVESILKVKDASETTGSSIEKIGALVQAAKITGDDFDPIAQGIIKMNKALAGTDDASKGAAHALETIGLSIKDLRQMDPADAFDTIAKSLDNFEDGGAKVALVMDIFGKSGAQLLPFMKDYVELGPQVSKVTAEQAEQAESYERNLRKLQAAKQELYKVIATQALPVADAFVKMLVQTSNETNGVKDKAKALANDGSMESFFREAGRAGAALLDVLTLIKNAVLQVADSFGVVWNDIKTGAEVAMLAIGSGFTEEGQAAIKKALDARDAYIEAANKRMAERFSDLTPYTNKLEAIFKQQDADKANPPAVESKRSLGGYQSRAPSPVKVDGIDPFGSALDSLGQEAAKLQEQIAVWKKYGDAIDSAKGAQARYQVESGKFKGLSEKQKAMLVMQADAVDTLANELRPLKAAGEFEKQTDAINSNTAALGLNTRERELAAAAQELENKGIKRGTELFEEQMRKRREAMAARDDARASPITGLKEGLAELEARTADVAGNIKNVMVGAFDKASSALTDFVMTGKLNFNDFAKSVIADISKMIVKQLMFNALKSALGGTGIGAALGFAKGGAFDGGVQAFASGGIVDSPTPFRFASGGAVKPGVMGEAGPEAIMPLKRGRDGKLGVVASGGQHGGGVSIGSIVVQNNGEASASDTSGRNGAEMGKAIATAVQAEIIKQRRPGGLLYAA